MRSGSPIPIKTTFLVARRVPSSFFQNLFLIRVFAKSTWEMISSRVRSLLNPSFQVTQNLHFMAQPIWVERQSVILFSLREVLRSQCHQFSLTLWTFDFIDFWLCGCLDRWKRMTDSIVSPSWVLNHILILSLLSMISCGVSDITSNFSWSWSLRSLERVVISSKSVFWFLKISWKICFNLKGWSLLSLANISTAVVLSIEVFINI